MLRTLRTRIRRGTALLLAASLLAGSIGCSRMEFSQAETTAGGSEQTAAKAQADFAEKMEGLFREELSESLLDQHFLVKDPEALGIGEARHLYGSFTLNGMRQEAKDRAELKAELEALDPSLLTADQQLTRQILLSYLAAEQRADGLELYAQPLAPTIGTQAQLPILLSEYAFRKKQDVEDYLELIAGIDDYYAQILEFEQQKADAGLMMSDTAIDHVIESCESYLLVPGDNFLTATFSERLAEVPELSDADRAAYEGKNAALLESDFVPAYRSLINGLTALKGTGKNEGGQCGYPDGKRWYEYLAFAATGTSYSSVDEMLSAMEGDLDASLSEIASLLKQHPELEGQLESYAFRQTEPGAIFEELKTLTLTRFPELPACSYRFKDVPKALESSLSPAFYLVSPIDDSSSNTIYINHDPNQSTEKLYPIIAHEGYPGHLYQNVYFHTHCPEKLRMLLSFPGYTEGWATYVEQESCLLDNGLLPELGQLLAVNRRATLALSACLDVYINYLGWNRAQVKEFLAGFGDYPDETVGTIYDTMVETPANYLSYYVGCLEFQTLRREAEQKLGRQFDEKAFHTFLMDLGTAPFDVIRPHFKKWLTEQK